MIFGVNALRQSEIAALQSIRQKFQVKGSRVRLSIKFSITQQSGCDEEGNHWAIYFCRLSSIRSLVSSSFHWQSGSGLPFPDDTGHEALEEMMERRFDEALAEIEQIIKSSVEDLRI